MKTLLALVCLAAPQDDPGSILEKYRAARPAEGALAIYRLDWAPDLKSALERAGKEKRPVFFIATHQLEDAGSLYDGHC